ncbi:hypothetical protein LBBP_00840 [Leptospira borgpetersenii serovar Ballum]|uniref:Uncharacterized protein n=1 Tax=Leptospira borgpetersenii serovar Ballum TaxID=280505 RepID=A0A0S2INC9_LEPBO|nr:hypothetical protein LBBP_00840 [Leptospira borgpetersenii serovar Ballum]
MELDKFLMIQAGKSNFQKGGDIKGNFKDRGNSRPRGWP